MLSVLLFFVYTGVETAVGQWSYTVFVEGRDLAPQLASLGVSVYWGALAVGRVIAGVVTNRLAPRRWSGSAGRGCWWAPS